MGTQSSETIISGLPEVPRVTLGRSGIESTRLGVGCAVWPKKRSHDQVVEVFRAAFAAGIRHVDVAPVYGTEEIVGRALEEAGPPDDMVLATKACNYVDDLRIAYREYSAETAKRSVERSLKHLRADRLDIVHIHDVEAPFLPDIFAEDGAVQGLLDLKQQGVVRSIGMATVCLECQQAAVDSGEIEHIQPYHSYTLLNRDASRKLIPSARAAGLSILNNAPYAGYILQSGATPDALYNYEPASSEVINAVRRIEAICAEKNVTIAEAALAFSLSDADVDVTVVGTSSPERVRERVSVLDSSLTRTDFDEMISAAGDSFPLVPPYTGNPCRVTW